MNTTYRVEAHDGKGWAFGIRIDANKRIPVACNLLYATTGTKSEMKELREWAARICGGTLRVAPVNA